jgi:hypothetical protein
MTDTEFEELRSIWQDIYKNYPQRIAKIIIYAKPFGDMQKTSRHYGLVTTMKSMVTSEEKYEIVLVLLTPSSRQVSLKFNKNMTFNFHADDLIVYYPENFILTENLKDTSKYFNINNLPSSEFFNMKK